VFVTVDIFRIIQTGRSLVGCIARDGCPSGDRVAGYMSNIEEAATAMWPRRVLAQSGRVVAQNLFRGCMDRLGQIKPKVLFAVDGYIYKGKKFSILSNVKNVVSGVPSLEKVVMVPT